MSSEPQVIGSTAPQNSTERVLTRRDADLLPVYDVVDRWLHREPAFLHESEPERHLEEMALVTVAAKWLTRWAADQHAPGAARRHHPGSSGRGGRDERAGHVRAMEAVGRWAAPFADRRVPGVIHSRQECPWQRHCRFRAGGRNPGASRPSWVCLAPASFLLPGRLGSREVPHPLRPRGLPGTKGG